MPTPQAPPPPDYVGAAVAQGVANKEAAIATGKINNPNVINPYGSQTVTWNTNDTAAIPPPKGMDPVSAWHWNNDPAHQFKKGTDAIPTVVQKLSPEQQKLYMTKTAGQQMLAEGGLNLGNQAKVAMAKPLSFKGAPAAPILPSTANKLRQDALTATMSRVNTDTAGQRDAANSNLIAAGIRPGTAAYKTAMDQINRGYNDARMQAILGAGQQAAQDYGMQAQNYGLGMQGRTQGISEILALRETPMNEAGALQSGTQVSNPFAGGLGYQAGANMNAAPVAQGIANQGQAAQNMYNVQQAGANSNLSAGAGLLGSIGSAYIR